MTQRNHFKSAICLFLFLLSFDWFRGDRIACSSFIGCQLTSFSSISSFLGPYENTKPWIFLCPVRKHTHSFLCGETVGGYTI